MSYDRHTIQIRITDTELEKTYEDNDPFNLQAGATLAGVFHIEYVRYNPMLAQTTLMVTNGIFPEVPESCEPPAFTFKDALQHYHDLVMAKG